VGARVGLPVALPSAVPRPRIETAVRCPSCGADDDRVVDSRPASDGTAIRRRRECRACGLRFTTFERAELPALLVTKRSGAVTPFARQKVLDGVSRAAQGRLPAAELEEIVTAVERAVRALGTSPVTSEQVGLAVLAELSARDQVTYVRFASVYRDFQGAEDFEQALSVLRKEAPPKTWPDEVSATG
jgi:transcriptional repressor NrdR